MGKGLYPKPNQQQTAEESFRNTTSGAEAGNFFDQELMKAREAKKKAGTPGGSPTSGSNSVEQPTDGISTSSPEGSTEPINWFDPSGIPGANISRSVNVADIDVNLDNIDPLPGPYTPEQKQKARESLVERINKRNIDFKDAVNLAKADPSLSPDDVYLSIQKPQTYEYQKAYKLMDQELEKAFPTVEQSLKPEFKKSIIANPNQLEGFVTNRESEYKKELADIRRKLAGITEVQNTSMGISGGAGSAVSYTDPAAAKQLLNRRKMLEQELSGLKSSYDKIQSLQKQQEIYETGNQFDDITAEQLGALKKKAVDPVGYENDRKRQEAGHELPEQTRFSNAQAALSDRVAYLATRIEDAYDARRQSDNPQTERQFEVALKEFQDEYNRLLTLSDKYPEVRRNEKLQGALEAYAEIVGTQRALRQVSPLMFGTGTLRNLAGLVFNEAPETAEEWKQLSKKTGLPVEELQQLDKDTRGIRRSNIRTTGLLSSIASSAMGTIRGVQASYNRWFGEGTPIEKDIYGEDLENKTMEDNRKASSDNLFIPETTVDLQKTAKDGSANPTFMRTIRNEKAGDFNLNPASFVNVAGETTAQLAIFASGGELIGGLAAGATKGIGRAVLANSELAAFQNAYKIADLGKKAELLGQYAGTMATGFAMSYDQNYREMAKETTDENKRHLGAILNASLEGGVELLNLDAGVVKALRGDKRRYKIFDQILNNNKGILTNKAVTEYASAIGKMLTDMGAEGTEEFLTAWGQAITTAVVAEKPLDVAKASEEAKQAFVTTFVGMLPTSAGAGFQGIGRLHKEALFEAGASPSNYKDWVYNQLKSGKMDQAKADKAMRTINTMQDIVSNMPRTNKKGEPLSEDQMVDLAAQEYRLRVNRKVKEESPIEAEKVMAEVDSQEAIKAQQEIISPDLIEKEEPEAETAEQEEEVDLNALLPEEEAGADEQPEVQPVAEEPAPAPVEEVAPAAEPTPTEVKTPNKDEETQEGQEGLLESTSPADLATGAETEKDSVPSTNPAPVSAAPKKVKEVFETRRGDVAKNHLDKFEEGEPVYKYDGGKWTRYEKMGPPGKDGTYRLKTESGQVIKDNNNSGQVWDEAEYEALNKLPPADREVVLAANTYAQPWHNKTVEDNLGYNQSEKKRERLIARYRELSEQFEPGGQPVEEKAPKAPTPTAAVPAPAATEPAEPKKASIRLVDNAEVDGEEIDIPGFEFMDVVLVDEGDNYSLYEKTTGRRVADGKKSKALTIANAKRVLENNKVTPDTLYAKLLSDEEAGKRSPVNPSAKYDAYKAEKGKPAKKTEAPAPPKTTVPTPVPPVEATVTPEPAPTPAPAPAPVEKTKEQIARENLEKAKKELARAMGKLSSGPNPEIIIAGSKVMLFMAELGIYKFRDLVREMASMGAEFLTSESVEILKGVYSYNYSQLPRESRVNYDNLDQMEAFIEDELPALRQEILNDLSDTEIAEVRKQILDLAEAQLRSNDRFVTAVQNSDDQNARIHAADKLQGAISDAARELIISKKASPSAINAIDYKELAEIHAPVIVSELKSLINEQSETNEQPRDIQTIELEGEIAISEATSADTDSERKGKAVEKIDELIEEIDSQLRLLTEHKGPVDHEYGTSSKAEAAFKKDLTKFSKELARLLNYQHDTNKKGKVVIADINLPPAGGNGTIILWKPGTEFGVYISVPMAREYLSGSETDVDRLFLDSSVKDFETGKPMFLWRVTSKGNKYTGFGNMWANYDITAGELAKKIRKAVDAYIKVDTQKNTNNETGALSEQLRPDQGTVDGTIPTTTTTAPPSTGPTETVSNQPGGGIAAQGTGAGTGGTKGGRSAGSGAGGNRNTGTGSGSGTSSQTNQSRPPAGDNVQPGTVSKDRPENPDERNLSIPPELDIVPKGNVEKVTANMNAILLLRKLEAEDRLATPEEKIQLAKFVGWGGLAPYLDGNRYDRLTEAIMEGTEITIRMYPKETFNPGPALDTTGKSFEQIVNEFRDAYVKAMNSNPMMARYGASATERGVTLDFARKQVIPFLLSAEELDTAINSTINAHYTDGRVIRAMWDLIKQLGFNGGRVLESSAGIGHFFGMMPPELANSSEMTGVELESLTGRMLKKIYPENSIFVKGFEDTNFPLSSFDLAVGNVPFGKAGLVTDTKHPDIDRFSLHNYFIAKNLKLLKPGGLAVLITSKATMDGNAEARRWFSSKDGGNSDLVGAIRLPNNAFSENAGTQVTTDILVFRKRTGDIANTEQFINTDVVRSEFFEEDEVSEDIEVNEYFIKNPDHMIGEMKYAFEVGAGGLYGKYDATLHAPEGTDVEAKMRELFSKFPTGIYKKSSNPTVDTPAKRIMSAEKSGKLFLKDGVIYQSEGDTAIEAPIRYNTQKAVAKDYIPLRDAVYPLLEAELDPEATDDQIEGYRKALNEQYDKFASKHGSVANHKFLFEADVDYPLVSGLENVKKITSVNEKGKVKVELDVTKGDMLLKRVNFPPSMPTTASSFDDAIKISISYKGNIDLGYVAELMKTTPEAAEEQMLKDQLVFKNPANGLLEVPDMYLAGTVRAKLEAARTAAMDDSNFERNVRALEAVQPPLKPASSIRFKIGVGWLPVEIYQNFVQEKFGVSADFAFNEQTQNWSIRIRGGERDSRNTQTYAAGGRDAMELMEAAMSNRTIVVKYKDSDGNVHTDEKATVAVKDMMDKINDDFARFVKSNDQYRETLEREFNLKMNDWVEPKTSLPVFESFPGAVREMGGKPFRLRQHQIKAVLRAIIGNTLFAHDVGTGKTYTQITTAMEWRRLGIAKKPMIVVKNATLNSFAKDFKKLYPTAKLLVVSRDEIDAKNRKLFFGRIATGDYDAIILPHSQFDKIPDHPDRIAQYIKEKIEELELTLSDLDKNDYWKRKDIEKELESLRDEEATLYLSPEEKKAIADQAKDKKGKVKKQAIRNATAKARAQKLTNRAVDNILFFDQMGVDGLIIDESHAYKRLGFSSAIEKVKGIDKAASKRAVSAYLKIQSVMDKTGGKNIVFATGTPVTNTMAELWTNMRYLIPNTLRRMGIVGFDQFQQSYTEVVESVEQNAGGGWEVYNRLSTFFNLGSLVQTFRSFADVVSTDDIPEFKEDPDNAPPKLATGKIQSMVLPITPAIRGIMNDIASAYASYKQLSGRAKREQSWVPLLLHNLGKIAPIDPRLVDPSLPDDPGSKANVAVKKALELYRQYDQYKATQMIFSDSIQNSRSKNINELLGITSKGEFNLYEDIKAKLIAGGVPAHEIALMTDSKYEGDEKKKKLFDMVNEGTIRFVIGSTEKMGVGVNAQERMIGLHHIDAPVRPDMFTQRNGRIIRQGSIFAKLGIPVHVMAYGVENTSDATAFQRLEKKQGFITQLFSGDITVDETEDVAAGDDGESADDFFANLGASLSGNKDAIRLVMVKKDLRREENRKNAYHDRIDDAGRKLSNLKRSIPEIHSMISQADPALALYKEKFEDGNIKSVSIDGTTYTDKIYAEIDAVIKKMSDRAEQKALESPDKEITEVKIFKINDVEAKLTILRVYDRKKKKLSDSSVYLKVAGIGFGNPLLDRYSYSSEYGRGIASGTGSGMMQTLRNFLDNVQENPQRFRDLLTQTEKNISSLEKDVEEKYDSTRLRELMAEKDMLEQRMLSDGKKRFVVKALDDKSYFVFDELTGLEMVDDAGATIYYSEKAAAEVQAAKLNDEYAKTLSTTRFVVGKGMEPGKYGVVDRETTDQVAGTPDFPNMASAQLYAEQLNDEMFGVNQNKKYFPVLVNHVADRYVFKIGVQEESDATDAGYKWVEDRNQNYYFTMDDAARAREIADQLNESEQNEDGSPKLHTTIAYGEENTWRNAQEQVYQDLGKLDAQGVLEASGAALGLLRNALKRRTVPRNWQEKEFVNFTGVQIGSPVDLVQLFTIHRSPLIEKLHIVFMQGDTILANHALTSGNVSEVEMPPVQGIIDAAKNMEATGIYILHNHPSGNALASVADVNLTRELAEGLEANGLDFRGHMVIDTGKFSLISADGSRELMDYREPVRPLFQTRIQLAPGNRGRNQIKQLGDLILKSEKANNAVVYLSTDAAIAGYDTVMPEDINNANIEKIMESQGAYGYMMITDNKDLFDQVITGNKEMGSGLIDVILVQPDGKAISGRKDMGVTINQRLKPASEVQNLWDNVAELLQYAPGNDVQDGWYSSMQRTIYEQGNSQTGGSWISWFAARNQDGTISRDEVKWSGVLDMLEEKANEKLSKLDIMRYLAANKLQVKEQVLVDDPAVVIYSEMIEAERRLAAAGFTENDTNLPAELQQDADIVNRYMEFNRVDAENRKPGILRHKGMTLRASTIPGTDKEIALYADSEKVAPYKIEDTTHYGDIGNGKTIAWIRLNEKTDAAGDRVLFIEEIQSMRHQHAAKGNTVPEAPFKNSWVDLAARRAILYAVQNGINKIAWTNAEQQIERNEITVPPYPSIQIVPKAGGLLDFYGSDERGEYTLVQADQDIQALGYMVGGNMAAADEIYQEYMKWKEESKGMSDIDFGPFTSDAPAKYMESPQITGMVNFYGSVQGGKAGEVGKAFLNNVKPLAPGIKLESVDIPGAGSQGAIVLPAETAEKIKQEGLPVFQRPPFPKKLSDRIRALRINNNRAYSLVLPVPAIWNAAVTMVANAIDAGDAIQDAFRKGYDWIRANYKEPWSKGLYEKEMMKEMQSKGVFQYNLTTRQQREANKIIRMAMEGNKFATIMDQVRRTYEDRLTKLWEANATFDEMDRLVQTYEELRRYILDGVVAAEYDSMAHFSMDLKDMGKMDKVRKKLQNRMLRLEQAQAAASEAGVNIENENDAVNRADRWRSIAETKVNRILAQLGIADVDVFLGKGRKTIENSLFDQMAKDGIDYRKFNLFLYALHAPERNAHNAKKRRERATIQLNELEQEWEIRQAQVDALQQALDEAIELEMDEQDPRIIRNLKRDLNSAKGVAARYYNQYRNMLDYMEAYSDETVPRNQVRILEGRIPKQYWLMDDGGSGMTNKQAEEIINEVRSEGLYDKFEAYGKAFRSMVIEPALDMQLEYGMIDLQQYYYLRDYYQHYVPLQVDDDYFESEESYTSKGLPGANIWRSKGADYITYESRVNPMTSAIVNLQGTVYDGEKNAFMITLAKLVESAPDEKVWSIEQAKYTMIQTKSGKIIGKNEIGIPANGIPFMQDGVKKYIVIPDVELRNAITEKDVTKAIPVLGKANAFFRAFATLYNPNFILANLFRDMETAGLMLSAQQSAEVRKQFRKNLLQVHKILRGSYKAQGDATATNANQTYWEKVAQEYREMGGQMSWWRPESTDQIREDIQADYQRYLEGGGAADVTKKLTVGAFDWFNRVNTSIEEATRLSVYDAAVKAGMSKEKAVELARNITVNFNKKGELGATMDSMYLFANASIQGSANVLKAMLTTKRGAYTAAALMLAGATQSLVNNFLSKCDDPEKPENCYQNIQAWEKEKYIIIKTPGADGFIRIPIAYGFNVFYFIGEQLAEVFAGKQHPGVAATYASLALVNAFNPVGSIDQGVLQAVSPTALDPIVQFETNRDALGRKIYQDFEFDKRPDSERFSKANSPVSVEFAQWLNKVSGGSEHIKGKADVSPGTLDWLAGTVFGGTGNFAKQVMTIGHAAATGNAGEVETRDVPLFGRFYSLPRERSDRDYIYKHLDASHNTIQSKTSQEKFEKELDHAVKLGEIDAKKAETYRNKIRKNQVELNNPWIRSFLDQAKSRPLEEFEKEEFGARIEGLIESGVLTPREWRNYRAQISKSQREIAQE